MSSSEQKEKRTKWIMTEQKFLTDDEIGKLSKYIRQLSKSDNRRDRVKAIILGLGIGAGLRASEIASIRTYDLNVSKGMSSLLVCNGKGGKTAPVIIGPKLKTQLRLYLNWKKENEYAEEGYLLINERGMKYTRIGIYKIVKQAFKTLKFPTRYSPHSLRHSFATMIYSSSKCLRTTSIQCRHSSTDVTSVYAGVKNEDVINAMQKFG